MVITSVICTSRTEERIVMVRSLITSRCTLGGSHVRNCGRIALNQVGCANDVRVRLLEHDQQHGALVVEQTGLVAICLRVDRSADIAQRNRRSVVLRDNDGLVLLGLS